nr:porin family protein [uncultured Prevotella sp.]
MKRIITLAFLSAISLASFAQSKIGTWSVIPHVGVSIASLTHQSGGIEVGGNQSQEVKPQARPGFTGGVDVLYQASDIVGLSVGLSYVQAGCKYKDVDDNGVIWHDHYARTDYISVPLVAHSYIAPGLSINVGVAPSFLIYGKYHAGMQTYDLDTDGHRTNVKEAEIDQDIKKGLRNFTLSIPVGISYEYENVVLDARYNVGVLNAYKYGLTARNKVFEVSVGYKFDL